MDDPASIPATVNGAAPGVTVPQAAMAWTPNEATGLLEPRPRSAEAGMRRALLKVRDFLKEQCTALPGPAHDSHTNCLWCYHVSLIEEAVE